MELLELNNGAIVLRADLWNMDGTPRGVVLAETMTDFVTWTVGMSEHGWDAFSGHYFAKNASDNGHKALHDATRDYHDRRGLL